METLQNQKYRDIVSIRLYYDWHTCVSRFPIIRHPTDRKYPGKQRRPDGGIRTADAKHAAVYVNYQEEGKKCLPFEKSRYDKKQEERETTDHEGGFKWGNNLEDSTNEVPILGSGAEIYIHWTNSIR